MDAEHNRMSFDVSYRIMLVDRGTGHEVERLDGVLDGGSIERNQDTSVTEQASLNYVGAIDGLERVLLRVYADLDYEDGSTESIALGTFVPDASRVDVTGDGANNAPLTLYGRLRELQDDMFDAPVSIPAGSNPVDIAAGWCRAAGLTVAAYPACSYRLGSVMTFGGGQDGDSKLAVVNKLLDLAGWQSARTNPYGEVVLQPYVRPQDKSPVWEFVEGEGARFVRQMTDEIDWFNVANKMIVSYANNDTEVVGVAVDDDPQSPFSVQARGRVIARREQYSDVPDNLTGASLQEYANAKALDLLTTEQSVIRRITLTHIYAPVTIGDVITVSYPSGSVHGRYAVRTQKISLVGGLPVECEARAYVRSINHD